MRQRYSLNKMNDTGFAEEQIESCTCILGPDFGADLNDSDISTLLCQYFTLCKGMNLRLATTVSGKSTSWVGNGDQPVPIVSYRILKKKKNTKLQLRCQCKYPKQ